MTPKLVKLNLAINNLKNYLITLTVTAITNAVSAIKLIEALIHEVELLIPKVMRDLNTAIANDQIQQAVCMIQKIKYNNRPR